MNEPSEPTQPASAPTAPRSHPEAQDALPAGSRLGEFEVLQVLGVGGFGIVYLAMDHALERQVAIKEYLPSSLAGRGHGAQVSLRSSTHVETFGIGLRSFVNEAKLLARFDHPSLVKVYRFWEANGTAYMVMPFYAGRTLRDERRAMAQAPDEAWLRRLVNPLLGALEVLHGEGVYHRDIAPDNILLLPDGRPVLLDFGAARRVIGDRTQTLTAILKPNYAPIEQYADVGQLRQGPWTDLYALGAVLHYVATGKPPTPSAARAVHDEVAPLATLDPAQTGHWSAQVLASIDWALMVRPNHRPQNVGQLRDALEGRITPPERTVTDYEASPTVLRQKVEAAWAPTLPERPVPTANTAYAPTALMPSAHTSPKAAPESTVLLPQRQPEPQALPQAAHPPAAPVASLSTPSRTRTALLAGLAVAVLAALMGGAWMLGVREGASEPTEALPASVEAPVAVPTPMRALQAEPAPPASPIGTAASQPLVPAVAALPVIAAKQAPPAVAPTAAVEPRVVSPRRPKPAPDRPATTDASPAVAPSPTPPDARAAIAPPPAEPAGPASPREACGSRVFIALTNCLRRQCESARFRTHAECERMRHVEELRQRNPLSR